MIVMFSLLFLLIQKLYKKSPRNARVIGLVENTGTFLLDKVYMQI